MNTVSNPATNALFELKSANLPLLALLLKTTDAQAIAEEFSRRFKADMFDDDPLVIDLSPLVDDTPAPDFDALSKLLRQHKLQPVAFRGGPIALQQAAKHAGLVEAADVAVVPNRPSSPDEVAAAASPTPPPAAVAAAKLETPATHTLIIDRPLRSGQQIYARGADLVVLGAVNFGAEVMADGSIHVYAPLRGRAVAGARGHHGARIFSTCMEPQLISIAGTYRTTETPLAPEVLSKPAQVRLEGERLLIEPLGK